MRNLNLTWRRLTAANWWRDLSYGAYVYCGVATVLSILLGRLANPFNSFGAVAGMVSLFAWVTAVGVTIVVSSVGLYLFWTEPGLLLLVALSVASLGLPFLVDLGVWDAQKVPTLLETGLAIAFAIASLGLAFRWLVRRRVQDLR